MLYSVPDWDDNSHGLKAHHIGKEGVHQHLHQNYLHQHYHSLQTKSSVALVPNNDVSASLTQMGMQGDAGTHIPERSSVPALEVHPMMNNPCAHEDEMLSWLRYPLVDSYDQNYCSEIFGELVNPHIHLVKDAYIHQTMQGSENVDVPQIEGMGCEQVGLQQLMNATSMHCPRAGFKSDAALAMGAGRAAGLLSQSGSEVFHGVRTHVHPSGLLKPSSSSAAEPLPEQAVGGQTTSQVQWQDGRAAGNRVFDSCMDPMMSLLDMKKTSVLSPTTPLMSTGLNFSVFSRPVATALDSLRFVGGASGPTNVERARQPLSKDSPPLCETSMGDSNCSVVMNLPSSQQSTEFSIQDKVARDGSGYTLSDWCLPRSLPCRPDVRMHDETSELNNCVSGSAITVSENVLGTIETVETTVSPSQLSGSSTEKTVEEARTSTPKRTSFSAEYSEDVEDITANAKKPPPGPRAMKRTRAAETHNESEKKRRNKINVRLKALQSLIPNSNKTDKASVLDEAIEYTKMLQAQVQFMSMRTGIYVPMPSAMQYVPVQQMATLSHMGMGIGMGLGVGVDTSVGMHVTDINEATAGICCAGAVAGAGAGAAMNLSPTSNQSPSRQALSGVRLPQTSFAPLIRDVSGCLPTSSASEPYKVMLAQQPLQPVLMNAQMNADTYSALLQSRQPQENHISNASR